jgi:hypothetical protein
MWGRLGQLSSAFGFAGCADSWFGIIWLQSARKLHDFPLLCCFSR